LAVRQTGLEGIDGNLSQVGALFRGDRYHWTHIVEAILCETERDGESGGGREEREGRVKKTD